VACPVSLAMVTLTASSPASRADKHRGEFLLDDGITRASSSPQWLGTLQADGQDSIFTFGLRR